MSKVPEKLKASLAALALIAGLGGGAYVAQDAASKAAEKDEYVQAVANDPTASPGVKVAMVMGSYYESSGRHIGKPYIDKLGKGQPWTVCNGITGKDVIPGKWYTPSECYNLEKGRYFIAERVAKQQFRYWDSYSAFQQGTFLDFVHNKGSNALITSTLLRKANAGDWVGACRENTRWNRGTINGVSTVLPGLVVRGNSNSEICTDWT